ncbi:MAG: hypothetical protein KF745_14330 [Phycisphaeraceae bacterium]|nr:hypothetical protein [Phycisphaeraceae bacterium]
MKRAAIILAGFLAIGVLANVAAAWLCILLNSDLSYERPEWTQWPEREGFLEVSTVDGRSARGLSVLVMVGYVPLLREDQALGAGDIAWCRREILVAGWPFPALACDAFHGTQGLIDTGDSSFARSGVGLGSQAWTTVEPNGMTWHIANKRLPVQPVWPGFLYGVLLYGGLPAALVLGIGAFRRRWRRSRSQCERCGYPIGQSPHCSECGNALPVAVTPRPIGAVSSG